MFKVGDKVRIVGPSQTGGNDRRGEVANVEFITMDDMGPCYNVTKSDRSEYYSYYATSLEALLGKDEITINGVTYVRKVAEKTNAEKLERIFELSKQNGQCIFKSKYETDLEVKVTIAGISRTGNRVTVVYDAGE